MFASPKQDKLLFREYNDVNCIIDMLYIESNSLQYYATIMDDKDENKKICNVVFLYKGGTFSSRGASFAIFLLLLLKATLPKLLLLKATLPA